MEQENQNSKEFQYVLLTPLGPSKLYSWEEFKKAASAFQPAAKEKVVCVNSDQEIICEGFTILAADSSTPDFMDLPLKRLALAREKLKDYFLQSPYDWALWLDSDILAPPHLPAQLKAAADQENSIAVVNAYPGRNEGGYWRGAGCMLTHREACEGNGFKIFKVGEKHLSEDTYFLSLLRGLNVFADFLGKKTIVEGRFAQVQHIIGGGQG